MERQEYPAMLASLEPNSAVAILNGRMNHVTKTYRDIAGWLEERKKVEEAYVQGLRRLIRKEPPGADSDLGIFTSPWQKIVEAARDLAGSHTEFALRIENDIVSSLRNFETQNREMQQMSTIQGNLAAMAKEYDQAQKRAEKMNAKGGRAAAGRVAGASDDVDSATQQWESQAPYVFEQLQAVDETRLNHLRDVLTQFETHEVDHVEKAKEQAESCLNSLLNVNVADEIQTWSRKRTEGAQRMQSRTPVPPRTSSRDEHFETPPPVTSRMERRTSRQVSEGPSLAPPPTIGTNGDDRTSQREPSMTEEKKKPRGLRRLGTVFSKRRQSVMPGFGRPTPGRNKSSRLGSNTDLTEDQPPELPTPPPPAKDRQPATVPSSSAENTSQSEMAFPQRTTSYGMTNGASRLPDPLVPASTAGAAAIEPASQAPSSQPQSQPDTTPRPTTNETFATRPPSNDANDPISAAQREAAAAGTGSGYADVSDSASLQQQNAFNLSIRNAPIAEENSAANTEAMANVASALRAQAPTPTRRAGTLRGRRDVRNTVFVPSDQAPVFEDRAVGSQPPVSTPFTPGLKTAVPSTTPHATQRPFSSSEDHASSDTQSVRSGRSLSSATAGGAPVVKHPDMQTPGLNFSMIETVNATFESGQLTKGSIVGELALTHTPDPTSTASSGRETIRLDNFPILEKVAPNPAFVHDIGQSSTDRKGEYTVDLTTLSARPSVAFKYQLHIDAVNPTATVSKHAPLTLTPSWKCEANQTSVIVSYSLHPSFTGVASGEVVLHNVVIALYLEGTKTTTCQTKPSGTFSKEKAVVYWRMEEMKLSAATGASKVLARFGTETQGRPGRVEARWEIQPGSAAREGGLGVSRLEAGSGADPFADDSAAWKPVSGNRKIIAGTYVGT